MCAFVKILFTHPHTKHTVDNTTKHLLKYLTEFWRANVVIPCNDKIDQIVYCQLESSSNQYFDWHSINAGVTASQELSVLIHVLNPSRKFPHSSWLYFVVSSRVNGEIMMT